MLGWLPQRETLGGTAGDPQVLPGVLCEDSRAGPAVLHQRALQQQPQLQLLAGPQGRPRPRAPRAKAKVHWELTGPVGHRLPAQGQAQVLHFVRPWEG